MGKVTRGQGAYIRGPEAQRLSGPEDELQRCKSERCSCAKVQKWEAEMSFGSQVSGAGSHVRVVRYGDGCGS